jgi:hypothetical protein
MERLGRMCLFFIVMAVASAGRVNAADEAPAFKLELKPAPDLPNGKVATLQGTAHPEGDKFFVESVGVLQPVVITLIAQHKGDVIKIRLGKQRWDESLRTAETGAEGQVTLKLRTQGEVRMTVTAEGEKPYWLIVWAGDEVKPDFTPAITPMKDFKGKPGGTGSGGPAAAGGGGNTSGIIIAIILGALIVAGAILLKRKGGSK